METERDRMFLACHDCGVLQPALPQWLSWPDDIREEVTREFEAFVEFHRAHRLGQLWHTTSPSHADGPCWDPMATRTLEATDGTRSYLVTASRPSLDLPRTYAFTPGSFDLKNSVAVDADDLSRGLDLAFYPHALPPSKIDRFMAAVCDVVERIDPDGVAIAFDDADDPDVSIARMPEDAYQELVRRCAEIFDAMEVPLVTEFLRQNRDEDGLLAVRVRRHLTIITAAPEHEAAGL